VPGQGAGRDRLACATPAEISRLPIADDAVPV
ncbi:diguanylate cyclase, partial [Stenotrophomonas sp. KAs 5-3]